MAIAERAELAARLSLKDDFSGTLKRIEGNTKKSASIMRGAFSTALGVGLQKVAARGASALLSTITSGLSSLAELESATTSVDSAIKTVGLTGKVTSGQIATWANEIEASVGAAFDDKAITAAATTLLRYGKVTPNNLRPALVVMTDLAAKTGDVDSAASLLAKALADPTKAAGKLAKNGVILTKAEQDQIKALVKAGKVGAAQTLILDSLAKSTKGAAAASQGPYARSIATLHDAWEDATKALAVGFLPILEEVRDILSKELAKPETLNRIRDFGKGLAGGLSSLIDAAKKVPWAQVGDAMRLAGQGAKAAYDLFTGLPPWVQTAVLTGWGLNKLTGGALGTIVGELGKGLIKGILGINAGVVNINAAKVNAPGGLTPGGQIPPGGNSPGGLPGYGILNTILSIAGPLAILDSAMRLPTAFDTFSSELDALGNKDIPGASKALRDFGENLPVWMNPIKGLIETAVNMADRANPPVDQTGWRSDPKGTPTAVPFSASDYAAKLGKATVDAQIRAEARYAHPLVSEYAAQVGKAEAAALGRAEATAVGRIHDVSSTTMRALSAKMGDNLLKWKPSSTNQIEDRRNERWSTRGWSNEPPPPRLAKEQTTAINRVQQVASTKLAILERKATEGKTATDRSGSAIVSATRNEQGAVVSAINGMRLQNTTNLTINVPGQAPIYRTYQTGTTMNRVTTGTGSAELQRRTG